MSHRRKKLVRENDSVQIAIGASVVDRRRSRLSPTWTDDLLERALHITVERHSFTTRNRAIR